MHALCIGLMSGTSMDAVDAALCRMDENRVVGVEAVHRLEYPAPLRRRLIDLQLDPDTSLTLRELAELDHGVAETFAAAALGVMHGRPAATVCCIGSHGQTVFHDPQRARNSLQLGDPSLIAARTGVTVVADFRRADVARGGQGAPLVPAFHLASFGTLTPCAVLNLGGIANLTVLPGSGTAYGFDTGPGNGLLDAWIARHRNARYDRGGQWAATGTVNTALLEACLDDDYFRRPPPKSTGRDHFNLAWLQQRFPALEALPAADVQRTLVEVTARSISAQLQRTAPDIRRVLVCGGGVHNPVLLASLRSAMPGVTIESTLAAGLDPDQVEAAAFAWLAWRRLQGRPGNLPSATGASAAAILGGIYAP
ncbi:anhydro-N-acetylmuramic acid kinase [Fontimonas sp. SYSU GA230001]|uniref:anhydro-N-acetylmuramic acid kinase n=1 Tax=Fontimonas sp. SYSU GA230001 TaxID=3142450 RepID=UPI0032B3C2C7